MKQALKRCGNSPHRVAEELRVGTRPVASDGRFSGYASIFNEVDQGRDAVAKGAFSTSLRKKSAKGVRMLFQHDPASPIGVWDRIVEDHKGLFVEGRIAQGVKQGEEVLELMRAGAIDGLSIGFKTRRARNDPSKRIRWIVSADLWEVSIVTFPLLDTARITSVKLECPPRKSPGVHGCEYQVADELRPAITTRNYSYGSRHDAAAVHTLQQKICRITRLLKPRN